MKSILILITTGVNVIGVSMLLWGISLLGKPFNQPDVNIDKQTNFECGFENTSMGDGSVIFKGSIVFMFLLVYDLELLLLMPIAMNAALLPQVIYPAMLILCTIAYTCWADIEMKTLEYDN